MYLNEPIQFDIAIIIIFHYYAELVTSNVKLTEEYSPGAYEHSELKTDLKKHSTNGKPNSGLFPQLKTYQARTAKLMY